MSPTAIAIGAVALVVVVVVALVLVKVTGSSSGGGSNNNNGPAVTLASSSLVSEVTSVPVSVAQAVGLPTGSGSSGFLAVPSVVKGQKLLTDNGKPGATFIGAEFCPYCAAERWAMIMAFSRFGSFSNLHQTTSSPWDTDPATNTFTFRGASYASTTVGFNPIEYESNDTGSGGAGRHIIQPLTKAEQDLWNKYSTHFGISPGFPFLDIGNKVFVTGPSYNPQVLAGLDWNEIAGKLSNPKDPVTQDIVGTATYITAGICAVTSPQASTWCTQPIIQQAEHSMGLS